MEREEGRNRRQARPRPNARRASTSIANYDYRADLRDRIVGLAVTALAWLLVMALGALMAWCLVCPSYHPISQAEWEAQLAAQTAGAE